ncbi:MarR family winged helix-turn-helix transcriptional regulator [Amaricoccus macauensis]|uniref:MarR family winged helix-turn-helix transcriptional regulator n=1 Tax=Amaricoccus macauensis TaxID=57001 RepID=UPI003C7AC506
MSANLTPTARLIEQLESNWPEAATPTMRISVMTQRLARFLQAQARKVLPQFDLSFTEFEFLAALRGAPERILTPSQLYDAALLSSGGTTKVLKHLEARGLIDRPSSTGDARSRPVRLTPTGCETIERAMAALQSADAELLGVRGRETEADRSASAIADILERAERMMIP